MKAARSYARATAAGGSGARSGGNMMPPPKATSMVYDDRVQCKFCGRKFNEQAAERHIPHCKNK